MPKRFSLLFGSPFWGRGFRPFFLLGAGYAALMVLAWALLFQGVIAVPLSWNNPVLWHAHEMIFGFTAAIIAGFLLTAVANWTGSAPVRHRNLALLTVVWLAGRAVFWCPVVPPLLLAVIDLSFLPLLAGSLAVPLIHTKNKRNFIFIGFLTVLFLGNLLMHLAVAGVIGVDARHTAYATVLVVMMVISLIGSRIIPSFTVAGLRMRGQHLFQTDQSKTDMAALFLLGLLLASVMAAGLESVVTGGFAMAAGLVHLWRMKYWHTFKTGCEPLLWILHAGHLWLVAGLLTLGLHGFGVIDQASLALHMLTVGCIGSLTLGMMARVSLGHTGRQIVIGQPVIASFWMMQGAVVVRCLAIIIRDENYTLWITASGLLWTAAFVIYLVVYTPMLLSARPDRQEA